MRYGSKETLEESRGILNSATTRSTLSCGLNQSCDLQFRIPSWPNWHYDLDLGTLTFSKDGISRVTASIQVVGTIVELHFTTGMNLVCYQECPVNWYKNDSAN